MLLGALRAPAAWLVIFPGGPRPPDPHAPGDPPLSADRSAAGWGWVCHLRWHDPRTPRCGFPARARFRCVGLGFVLPRAVAQPPGPPRRWLRPRWWLRLDLGSWCGFPGVLLVVGVWAAWCSGGFIVACLRSR